MAGKVGSRKRVDPNRWPGVYGYTSSTRRVDGKPDVCYYITYKVDGKKIWEKVGWKGEGYNPQTADELRSERVKKARHGKSVKTQKEIRQEERKRNRTLDEIAAAYFETRDIEKQSVKIDKGRYDNHVSPVLGNMSVRKLTVLDVQKIEARMKGLSPASIWGALEMLRRTINFGVRSSLCMPLPFKIKMPRRDNEVVEYLKPKQLERLLKVLDEWPSKDVVRMIRLAMLTGMRRGEIYKLRDEDLHFEQSLIVLKKPKGGQTVSIPMSSPVAALLEKQLEWRDLTASGSSFVFPGRGGGQRVNSSAVNRIKAEANLPKEFRIFHGLRHHYAVTLANSGEFSLDMIGELLTHKDRDMTKRYGQFLPDTKKKASERAASLLMKS
ncbi:tyrosine-type recombinase/integrase [Pseudodesulfovibrio indicus]|uniref:Recombinase n=1 Tax=Pseudodesulfovibrio indicus TaxID=1716143 RepID=A0A126QQG6_9BACT|nr:site-specific integrase [Pseudodesulfovibrio indicus]AMK12039.1 recombinase [Pseudodesulfovibrio indicus]TDT88638.1 site-specific recombinase XerD [Pseudodesulfovibrio indicus]